MKSLKSEYQYIRALRRLDVIYNAEPGSPESIELIDLVINIQEYEKRHNLISEPHDEHETCVHCVGFGTVKGETCWGCDGKGFIIED